MAAYEDDDRYVAARAMQLTDQLHTVQARHTNVSNDGVKVVPCECIQSLFTVRSFGNSAAEIAKPGRKDFAHIGLIIGNQDAGVGPGKRLRI